MTSEDEGEHTDDDVYKGKQKLGDVTRSARK